AEEEPAPGASDAADRRAAGAGGDFAAEAHRLGEMAAKLHLSLADAFGSEQARPEAWASALRSRLQELGSPSVTGELARRLGEIGTRAAPLLDALAQLHDAGRAVRVHGDFHLGQVMRSDVGWFVLDFEGEPARPLEERRARTSALKDVAGMLRSLHYAAAVAREERRAVGEQEAALADAWQRRNRLAFMDGYLHAHPDVDALLPPAGEPRDVVLAAFELEKAAYELRYELDHRPSWAEIPASALERLLSDEELRRLRIG
ncbi:MAG: phosphotransferase, partial [Acidimicrobiales bacterium]